MSLQQRIQALCDLGKDMYNMSDGISHAILQARSENPWFNEENCRLAVKNIANEMLMEDKLFSWVEKYDLDNIKSRKIGIVAAGNIPMVSFHDILCVLISGHHLLLKPSEKDRPITLYVLEYLSNKAIFRNSISILPRLSGFDAVIATGSDNTARYFEYYFHQYPRIIRKNRTSIAVLDGNETEKKLEALGHDIFDFYGLGCRNVTHLLVPDAYDFTAFKTALDKFDYIADHHKYRHNLDYQRTVYLMNSIPYLNIDHINVVENTSLFSPVSCLHYHYYTTNEEAEKYINNHKEEIQCICGALPFCNTVIGQTQAPGLFDYADNIDTLSFLSSLD